MDHDAVTKIVAPNGYGVGVWPNPYALAQTEWVRRSTCAQVQDIITDKIRALVEPRFITVPETAECIEAIITMTDSRRLLEIGTCTGFTTLHMVRAVYGKPGAYVASIDARPAHDREFWSKPEFKDVLEFWEGWTPDAIVELAKYTKSPFDLVFIDSDHSIEHTQKEIEALWNITRKGTIFLFHDVPEWQSPSHRASPPIRDWLLNTPMLKGVCLPSCEQPDCLDSFGPGYPKQVNPGLGIFLRQ